MKSTVLCLICILGICLSTAACNNDDPSGQRKTGVGCVGDLPDAVQVLPADKFTWASWRGPSQNGISFEQNPPTEWNEDTNILWKVKVPGRGHSSPTIVSDKIFLTTADKKAGTQSLLCFDRTNGDLLWNQTVNTGKLDKRIHINNTYASSTVASNGTAVFCVFVNDGMTQLSKYSLDGKQQWQLDLGKFKCDYKFGYGASPIYWNNKIIVSSECSADPFLVAVSAQDGSEVWRTARPADTNYSSPAVGKVAGKHQLLLSGSKTVKSYDPETGKELWSTPGEWSVTCGTMVWQDDIVFASGGFPASQTIAIKADGSAKEVWTNKVNCYEQSLLAHDGYVYGLADSGFCYCWKATTGELMWKERMRRKISASPVLAGEHIYFTTENGSCFVVKANPEKYELVAKNRLGSSAFATPTFVDDKIYARTGTFEPAGRQEWLYCIGKSE